MKFIIVFVALLVGALAAPPRGGDVEIVRLESDVQPESYKYGYETSDGSYHNEEGQLKNIGSEDEAIVVHGSFSFVGDDGQTYTVNYTADENGFQPQAAHIPQA